jgi:hypothetical protein
MIALTAIALVATTVVIHAMGTYGLILYLRRHHAAPRRLLKPSTALTTIIVTAVVLLLLHALEIQVWALAYLFLVPVEPLNALETATYFSYVTYTTLGYGDITLAAHQWRMLSGVEALDGILLVGWSTALLFAVVQRSWKSLIETGPGS